MAGGRKNSAGPFSAKWYRLAIIAHNAVAARPAAAFIPQQNIHSIFLLQQFPPVVCKENGS